MREDEYMQHDGLGLAAIAAAGDITARELLDLARARAERVNPRINAICGRLDEHADERAAASLSGPFAGVPFLTKDLYQDLAGMPSACGCRALRDQRAERTSTIVERWLAAGLVIFGRTTTPEFGSKGVTEAELYGPTRNPWNLGRTPGGSSGGAAAAVAAGIVPVAGASDGGGSIRIPAACTGLVGFKPGRGLVPFGPTASEPLNGIATHGVISRTVRDTAAMFDVLKGPDDVSAYLPSVPNERLLDSLDDDPGRLLIGYTTRSAIRSAPHPEAISAVEHAAQLLVDQGHDVEEVDPPFDDRQIGHDFLALWFVHQSHVVEEVKCRTGSGDEGFELDTRVMAALGAAMRATELHAADERRHKHIARLARLHATHDLLLTPTLGEPPIRIGQLDVAPVLRKLGDVALKLRGARVLKLSGQVDRVVEHSLEWTPYTQLANLTGRPAVSVPLYRTDDGLPMGVQFVGRLGAEGLLLRLARQLELAAPWAEIRP